MRALADTSVFIGQEQDRKMTAEVPDELLVSVVALGELRLGVLHAQTLEDRSLRLDTLRFVESLNPLPITDAVASEWADLVAKLRAAGKRKTPVNDVWIAATANAHKLPVAAQDGDYEDMPGVRTIRL